jgi:hypothetical protein
VPYYKRMENEISSKEQTSLFPYFYFSKEQIISNENEIRNENEIKNENEEEIRQIQEEEEEISQVQEEEIKEGIEEISLRRSNRIPQASIKL